MSRIPGRCIIRIDVIELNGTPHEGRVVSRFETEQTVPCHDALDVVLAIRMATRYHLRSVDPAPAPVIAV